MDHQTHTYTSEQPKNTSKQMNTKVSVSYFEKIFKLTNRKTNIRTEIIAGITTFMTMSYIIFVNPIILSDAGIPKEAAIAATISASVIATLLFSLWANMPVAIAPGMGLNAFFTYTVVLGKGLSWQTALGAVFISGVVFLLLTVTGIRQKLVEGVPEVLRSAIGVGIGLFIAFIGLKNAGIIVSNKATFVSLGHITAVGPVLALTRACCSVLFDGPEDKRSFSHQYTFCYHSCHAVRGRQNAKRSR